MNKLISITKAAKILEVHPETLRRWDKQGFFQAVRVNKRGDRRYSLDELEKWFENKNIQKNFKEKHGFYEKDVCSDCVERPAFIITQIGFASDTKLCNRHFLLFSKEFERWFLGELSSQ